MSRKKSRYSKPHPGRRVIPEHYERNVIVLDIPEQDKIDAITGKPLTVIRVERTEKVEVVPARLRVNVYERPIYGLPNRDGVVVAELPLFPIDKCMADNGFLADVAVKRFVDHLPYYRQAEASVRDGLPFHRNEFDEWMLILGDDVLVPLYEALRRDVLNRDYVGFDDSGIALQIKGLGKLHPARMWICRAGASPPHVFFRFSLTKEKEEPVALLNEFQGYAQADAAAGHDQVMKTDGIVEVGCWAHATRRFKQAAVYHPVETVPILDWLKHIYQVEEQTRDLPPQQRHAVRLASSKPVLDALFRTFEQLRAKLLPKSLLGEAVNYCLNQRAALLCYLEDGRLLIDNNAVERGIRPLGIGRKNWMFAGSERGGRTAAVFMSLFGSCRELKINPWLYMKDVLDRIMTHPKDRLRELLPGYWQPLERNTRLGVPVFLDDDATSPARRPS
ncbi:MAG: hypothetical protein A3K19_23795 [Lentisphaerae bacterium RIFOXYB12_FULL_65_16]|nr:MAG: hypothetical protein A3K19_23795 [Lentisphaerae bacterium RIFOXYB12_FULL_65_16]